MFPPSSFLHSFFSSLLSELLSTFRRTLESQWRSILGQMRRILGQLVPDRFRWHFDVTWRNSMKFADRQQPKWMLQNTICLFQMHFIKSGVMCNTGRLASCLSWLVRCAFTLRAERTLMFECWASVDPSYWRCQKDDVIGTFWGFVVSFHAFPFVVLSLFQSTGEECETSLREVGWKPRRITMRSTILCIHMHSYLYVLCKVITIIYYSSSFLNLQIYIYIILHTTQLCCM